MKAVIYTRVSSAEQVENFSLENQRSTCREFCQRNGYDVVHIFNEEGASAKSAERPQLLNMLKYVADKTNEVDALVVYKVDRFARQLFDHGSIKAALNKAGVQFFSATETFDDSPSGKLIENVMATFAQYDNDVRAERTKSGMRKAMESGRWVWQAPLGYVNNPIKNGPSILIQKPTADLIRYIFEQVALGYKTKAEILREVTAMGLETRKGKALSKQAMDALLKNPIYAGRVEQKKWDFEGPGDFEPVIGQELFDQVNSQKSVQKGRIHNNVHPDFPLRRFIICSGCGKYITGSWSRGRKSRYPYYKCENSKCRKVKLRKEKLESQFQEVLSALSVRPEALQLLSEVVKDVWKERTAEHHRDKKRHDTHILTLKRKKDRLVDAFIHDKVIDQETYQNRLDGLNKEIDETQDLIPIEPFNQDQVNEVILRSKTLLTDLPLCWNQLKPEQKPAFQKLIYPQGMIFDGEELGTANKSWLFIDFMDENNEREGLVHPSISDWNRFEEWINGVHVLVDSLNVSVYPALLLEERPIIMTPARDWNQL